MKKALITGITGQDGSYLAEWLLDKGYEVHGLVRMLGGIRRTEDRLPRIRAILPRLRIHYGDIVNYATVLELIRHVQPDECYHLASQSQVHYSFKAPFETFATNIDGTHYLLSAIRQFAPQCRFYFAASSEMFGQANSLVQNESTPFNPRSPYAISKVTGFHLTTYYRETFGLFACSGILYNHESPRRGYEFVTQKIVRSAIRIKQGAENLIALGNLETQRDWGYAAEYMRVIWRILQQDKPEDFVIGSGKTHSISDFVELAFDYVGLRFELVNLQGLSLEAADRELRRLQGRKAGVFVVQHPRFLRPVDIYVLCADISKARRQLQWSPQTHVPQLVRIMVEEAETSRNAEAIRS